MRVPWERGATEEEQATAMAHLVLDLVRNGDPGLIDLIDQGVPVDLADADGNTLLMLATHGGCVELVEGLVERGADVDRCNQRGQSPLAIAVFRRSPACARILVVGGADPTLGTPTARDALAMFPSDEVSAALSGPPLVEDPL